MTTRREISAKMPKWARVLFEPQWRYISLRGGRGSGKTKNIARALVLKASQGPVRILCTREIQDSIKDSVYAQLETEIKELGLESEFTLLRDEIRSNAGALFMFKGLNDLSVGGVKSTADINYCWVEEAQYLTEKSWNALTPTIRADGSQIWLSWNPELETDFIYERVVKEGLQNCASLFINFDQNPWLPSVLRDEEQDMSARDPIRHRHIWLGEPLPAVESAIYFDEIARMEREERTRNMTFDDILQTYIVMDLGIADFTSAWVVQQGAGEVRILDFIENNRVPQSWFSDQFTERGYDNAIICLPHDARAQNSHTGMTTVQLYEGLGWTVETVENLGVEEGIRMTREMLQRTLIDKSRCVGGIEHLKRYQRTKAGHPLHDEHSHACDALRYVAVHLPNMTNSKHDWGGKLQYRRLAVR
jgi:phage terminase large subunit